MITNHRLNTFFQFKNITWATFLIILISSVITKPVSGKIASPTKIEFQGFVTMNDTDRMTISGGVGSDALKIALEAFLTAKNDSCPIQYVLFSHSDIDSIMGLVNDIKSTSTYMKQAFWGRKKNLQAFAKSANVRYTLIVDYKKGQAVPIETEQMVSREPMLIEEIFGITPRPHPEIVVLDFYPIKTIRISMVDHATGKPVFTVSKSFGPFVKIGDPSKLQRKAFFKFKKRYPNCLELKR
jgi:hypothetical protein